MQKQKWWFRQWFFLLTWGVIWAWFFAMPRTIDSAWAVSSILIITWVGILVTIMHLILAEVSLSLPWHKTFVWMARSLFPPMLAQATLYINIINNIIGIIAYILLWWMFLQTLAWYLWLHLDVIRWTCMYVCVMGYFGIVSIKTLNKRDNVIVTILLLSIGIIIVAWLTYGSWELSSISTFHNNFRVYGIALFALSCVNAIPLLYHTTGWSAIQTRNVIIASWCSTTLIAITFALAIISLSRYVVSDNGIHGLALSWYSFLAVLWSIAWIAAIFSSHVPILENTQEVCMRDLKMSKLATWIWLTLLPFIIILYVDIGLLDLLWTAWSLLWGMLFLLACLLNIYLHRTQQKVRIIPMIGSDQTWSRILVIVCALWVLYQIASFY